MTHVSRVSSIMCVAVVLSLCTSNVARADFVAPSAEGIVRDGLEFPKDGSPDSLLEGGVVQSLNAPRFEDRGIVEFRIENLHHVRHAALVLRVFASMGPYPFNIDVFGYSGNGTLDLTDWCAGSYVAGFSYSGAPIVVLDVTEYIRMSIVARDASAGFSFRFSEQSEIEGNGPFVAFGSVDVPPAALLWIVR